MVAIFDYFFLIGMAPMTFLCACTRSTLKEEILGNAVEVIMVCFGCWNKRGWNN